MLRVTKHRRLSYQSGFIGPTHRRRADKVLRANGRARIMNPMIPKPFALRLSKPVLSAVEGRASRLSAASS